MTFTTDHEAETFLKSKGYEIVRGVIIRDLPVVSDVEWKAIRYLCSDWDFAFETRAAFVAREGRK
jgi:hypothetical protein